MSAIVPWIAGRTIRNNGTLFQRLYALQPPHVVVLDEPGVATVIKTKLPSTNVIYRWNMDLNDGNLHERMSAQDWVNRMVEHVNGDTRLMLYLLNEPPLNKAVADFALECLKIANKAGYALCVLNLGTGNPEPEKRDGTGKITQESQWELAKPVLEYLAANQQNILGLHEYAGGVITSGLIGGNPTMIKPGEWPALVPFTRWHCGRYQFLLDYCLRANLKAPRIVITEHGFDDTSDIKPWLETLEKTPPYANIRGWRSLVSQWRKWWPQWNAEQAYAEQVIWADKVLYGTPVEAQAIFTYGDSGGWEMFDTENAAEFWDLIVKHTKDRQTVTFPLPTDPKWQVSENQSGLDFPVRQTTISADTVATIRTGERFWYYPGSEVANWIVVKTIGGAIGYCDKGVLVVAPPKPDPIPLPPDEPDEPPPVVDLNHSIDALKMLITRKEDELSDANHVVARIDTELKLLRIVLSDLQTVAAERAA